MTTFLTIVSGVAVFVLGQLLLKLVIEPVHDVKRIIAEVAHVLIEDAIVFANPGTYGEEKEAEVSGKIRNLSSRLSAGIYLVPGYAITSKIFGLPTLEDATKATRKLIGLSNGFSSRPNRDILNSYLAQHVRDALGIHIPENERLDPNLEKEILNG